MSGVGKPDAERGIIDAHDFGDCKTTSTGLGIVASSAVAVGGLLSGNRVLAVMGVCSLASSLFGHTCAREVVTRDEIRGCVASLAETVDRQRTIILAKNELIQTQSNEIARLQKINGELEEKVQRLEQVQTSFEQLNIEHLQILEEQQKQIEEKRECLSRLSGLIDGYEQRKAKLLEEIRQTRAERETLQQDIRALLTEQKMINEELATRIAELGHIASQMQGAMKV